MEKENKVQVIPLGGLEEIGKNMTVVRSEGETFVIDVGMAFPGDEMLGVDIVVPNMSFLEEVKDELKGVFITHAHEDHIGGISYLLERFDVPIYASELTCKILRNKLRRNKDNIQQINDKTSIAFQFNTVEFFQTNHSIPGSLGVMINTPLGNVVHTGDFKIDHYPMDGKEMDLQKIARFGEEGVLALLSDSTNAERSGFSPSEKTVQDHLKKEIEVKKGRIFISTFASSLHRVISIYQIARDLGKKVIAFGKRMEDNVHAIKQLGYLPEYDDVFVNKNDLDKIDPNQLICIITGAQGEESAGLNRMSLGIHKKIEIEKGDTVIFSSSVIPGNEKSVNKVINQLLKKGVEVVQDPLLHTSGHGHREEQIIVFKLLKPKYFIPVHGEYKMLIKHKKMAMDLGCNDEEVILAENGDVIDVKENSISVSNRVPSEPVLVDQSGLSEVGSPILRDRRRMAEQGTVGLYITLREREELSVSVSLVLKGISTEVNTQSIAKEVEDKISPKVKRGMAYRKMKPFIYEEVGEVLYKHLKRKPMVIMMIEKEK